MNAMNIVTWILRLLVAAAFLAPAYFKLSGMPMMVDEFNKLGGGDAFRIFTGLVEVAGALLVLYPATTAWGALLLLCVMVGAFIANIMLHGDVVHVLVYAAVLAVLFYLTRDMVMKRLSGKA